MQKWLYGVAQVFTPNSDAVLELFVAGNYSKMMEDLSENEVKSHTMYLLSKITGETIPNPSFFRR